MRYASFKIGTLIFALCTLAACSNGASTAPSGAAADSASPVAAQMPSEAGGAVGNSCDVITTADMAGILVTPATRKDGPDLGACKYQTATKGQVTINVAQGDGANFWWSLATTTQGANVPLAGVGDKALYNAFAGGRPLIARKGNMTCFVDVVGYDNSDAMDSITRDRGEALAKKLGELCNKLFASH